jgi:hypothetical protein
VLLPQSCHIAITLEYSIHCAGLPVIPKIFHLTAPTKQLSWEERRIEQRFQYLLPDWQGNLWDDIDNSALMQREFPHLAARFEAIPFGVMKADIARCAYMHAYGGFYFDTDYKLLRPIGAELLSLNCVLPLEEGAIGTPDFKIGNAVFASAPGHPLWSQFIEYIFSAHAPEQLTDHRKIPSISGPRGLTNFYLEHKDRFSDLTLSDRNDFHPDRAWFGLQHRGGSSTYGIHLCWASWRGKSVRRAVTNFLRRKLTAPWQSPFSGRTPVADAKATIVTENIGRS